MIPPPLLEATFNFSTQFKFHSTGMAAKVCRLGVRSAPLPKDRKEVVG